MREGERARETERESMRERERERETEIVWGGSMRERKLKHDLLIPESSVMDNYWLCTSSQHGLTFHNL